MFASSRVEVLANTKMQTRLLLAGNGGQKENFGSWGRRKVFRYLSGKL